MAGEDDEYVHWVKTQPCLMRVKGGCSPGFVQAHHVGERGLGKKAHDHSCIPLCLEHHAAWHDCRPPFRGMTKEERSAFAATAVELQRTLYLKRSSGPGWF